MALFGCTLSALSAVLPDAHHVPMVTNWQRLIPWLAAVVITAGGAAVTLWFQSDNTVLAWVSAAVATLALVTGLAVRFGEDVLSVVEGLFENLHTRGGVFNRPDAPGWTVSVSVRLAGLAGAVATAYYLPRVLAEFSDVRSVTFSVVLVAGQFAGQALGFWLTRPASGELEFLRSLAAAARTRGAPGRSKTPADVIEFYARHFSAGARGGRSSRPRVDALGAEWDEPFASDMREHVGFRTPADMLHWLITRYPNGLLPHEAAELRADASRFERSVHRNEMERTSRLVGNGLFGTSVALRANRELTYRAGFVVDDAWSRLRLVLPGDLRRRHLMADAAVTWSRLVFAVALGWVVFCLLAWSWFVVAPVLLVVLAFVAGRRQMARASEMKVATADVYRFELAERLRVELPESQAEFAGLGAVLTGKEINWRLATAAGRTNSVVHNNTVMDTSRLENQLTRTQEQLVAMRKELFGEVRADAAQRDWQARTDERLAGLPALLKSSLAEALSGPTMVNFTGYLVVEHLDDDAFVNGSTIVAEPGSQVGVVVSVIANSGAQDSAPERGTQADQFMVLQPVHIEGGRTVSVVEFELVVDSATLRAAPRRHTVRVTPDSGQAQLQVSLLVPAQEGRHEAWLQLFQAGQLVQAIVVVVEAGHA
ncbi:hypothetical protein ACSHWB_47975 [Lentzea sp. HUAS TT2]|uniref:hypothetical protein n=1 Tax=Lentzea sp. HUAS TT2 TaxID=3447454 RepID=UPI003F70D083